MINELKIEKLFGRFSYNLKLMKNGVTIITGPNGFGKSTVLKIINALSNGNLAYFFQIDFFSINVTFDDNNNLSLLRNEKNIIINNEIKIDQDEYYPEFEQNNPWLRRVGKGTYLDRRTGKIITIDELGMLYDDLNYRLRKNDRSKLSKIIRSVKEKCGEVRFISEQRLIRKEYIHDDEEQVIEVINELPKKLQKEINIVYSEYSKVSNSLDGSYPRRLFDTKEGINDEKEYSLKREEANEKFNKLNKYDLVDMTLIERSNFDKKFSEALKIYFDDFSEKYAVFESLIKKLDLFTQIINERLTFKKVKISRQNGFEIVDTDNPKKTLNLSQLSSGEKQEIVLFYDLIFNTKSELLLLIDEPEISLHISWQKKFLDDLLKVSEDNKLNIIVATHSPQIISNHWDIQIDLGEEYGK